MVVVAWIPVLYSFKGLVQIVKGAQYCCCATNRKGQGDTDVESGQRAGQATAGTANGENEAVRGEGESTHTETGSVPPPYTA